MAAPGDVFCQRHDEGVLVADIDDQRWDVGLTQQPESIQSPFAADQQKGHLAIGPLALGHRDRLLETNAADVFNNFLEDLHVAVSRVQDLNPVNGDERHALGGVILHGSGSLA